jgi:hypothetical protein
MKKITTCFLLLIFNFINAQEADIKKSINTFFEGMHLGDTLKIKSVAIDNLMLQSVSEGKAGAKLTTDAASDFYKSIAGIPAAMKIEERLMDYKIQVDGAMAHVWAPYEFYINGKLSHKGVDSFQLFKDKETWKIIYIVDTRKK